MSAPEIWSGRSACEPVVAGGRGGHAAARGGLCHRWIRQHRADVCVAAAAAAAVSPGGARRRDHAVGDHGGWQVRRPERQAGDPARLRRPRRAVQPRSDRGAAGRELRAHLRRLERDRAAPARARPLPLGREGARAARQGGGGIPGGARERADRLPPVPLVAVLRPGHVQGRQERVPRERRAGLVLRRRPLRRDQARRGRCPGRVLDDRVGTLAGLLRRVRRDDRRPLRLRTERRRLRDLQRAPSRPGSATRPTRPT